MIDTLRQLEVFTAATEQESLTRAADQLYLTLNPPPVPICAHWSSAWHDAAAAQRTGRRNLTEDGQRLYPLAKKILTQCQALADAAGDPSAAGPPAAYAGGIHRAGAV